MSAIDRRVSPIVDRRLPWRVPWYLWVAIGLATLATIYVKAPQLLRGDSLFFVVLGLVLLLLVAALVWELPPAMLVCGGLALTVFSGNWTTMGLPGFPFVPDRILLVVALLALALRSPGAASLPRTRVTGVHLLMMIVVLYTVCSAVLAGTISNRSAIFGLLDRVGIVPFVIFFAAPAIFPTARERGWLLATLVATGAYLGVTAIFESIGPHALVFPRYIAVLDAARATGQATGPFAAVVSEGFACYACAIAAVIACRQWRGWWRWLAAAVALITTLGSFLSLERGVWIGAVAGAIAVALVAREVRRWLVPGICLCALVIGSAIMFSSVGAATTSRINDQLPVWDRENQTAAALRMVQAKPLLGFGWYNYVNTATPYFRLASNYPLTGFPGSNVRGITGTGPNLATGASGQTGSLLELHDTYLDYAVELGLVGACLWVVCVISGLGAGIFARGSPELRPWRLGLLALTVCFLVIAAVDPLSQNFVELLLWLWAGIAASGVCVSRRVPSPDRLRAVPTVETPA